MMGEDFFGLGGAAPVILMVILFYVLLYRPQKKQQEKQQDMVSKLKRGTRVVTRGGIYGKVDMVKETTIMLEVAEGVVIEVAKSMIATAIVGSEEERKELMSGTPANNDTAEKTDLDDAKDKE
ncbi:preprotein translocase subunit YajC [Anaerovibrio lipolyticus]|nr:preprotein translocase subunit YajC [Anaerovibrio lipolyticus]